MLVEAVTAINRTVILRLKRNLRLLAAVSAGHRVHLALFPAITVATALIAAVTATGRFILEPFLRIEFLFPCAKDELFTTFLAYECLVFESHEKISLPIVLFGNCASINFKFRLSKSANTASGKTRRSPATTSFSLPCLDEFILRDSLKFISLQFLRFPYLNFDLEVPK